jgi:hypothetical protein
MTKLYAKNEPQNFHLIYILKEMDKITPVIDIKKINSRMHEKVNVHNFKNVISF